MNQTVRNLGMFIVVLGIIALVMGAIFIYQGFTKQDWLVSTMKAEQITFDINGKQVLIDSMQTAKQAGDTVREHRHNISPTYGDLLSGNKFDPTNPTQLTYAQALNLENYLYLAVATFGLITVVLASGGFMFLTGIALGATGLSLLRLSKSIS